MNRALGALTLAGALALSACGGGPDLKIAEEHAPDNEAEVTARLIEVTKKALEARFEEEEKNAQYRRFNQPWHSGCLKADFTVGSDLPPELRVGLFANPATYPTWIRFANATSTMDAPEEDFRGMSLKVMRVGGRKLLGSGTNQDFILNSYPVLFVGTSEDFLDFIDRGPSRFSRLLFFLNPFNLHIRELKIVRAGRQNHAGHLTIPYWSTTPYLYGDGSAVKYSARPCGGVTSETVEDPEPNYLLDAMRGQLASGGACFDFMVQFQTDPEAMPIEDATVEWDESLSPFRTVARVDIPPQSFESPERRAFCERLAFNPWHSLAEHRPLGGLNRARKDLYRELAEFRHERNHVTYEEPTGDEVF